MSITVKVTKRQQVAHAKKMAILESQAFQEWWAARQTYYPTPRDPYRAFMIDLGLYATPHHKEVWKHRTNRYDYPPIDLPRGMPAPKRRLPPRKQIKRFKKRPKAAQPIVHTPFEKELLTEAEKFFEKYHLPPAEVRFEPRRGAAYSPSLFGKAKILMPRKYVARGAKIAGVRQQVIATITHEKGHHAHVVYGTSEKAMAKGLEALAGTITEVPTEYGLGRLETERIAWRIAKLHKGTAWKPIMGWRKKYAFGTYLQAYGKIKGH